MYWTFSSLATFGINSPLSENAARSRWSSGVGAILEVEVADAEVLPLVHLVTELDAHQLRLRQLVIEPPDANIRSLGRRTTSL